MSGYFQVLKIQSRIEMKYVLSSFVFYTVAGVLYCRHSIIANKHITAPFPGFVLKNLPSLLVSQLSLSMGLKFETDDK
jgi:hypothetical protein